jgi:aerobic carbon-monoxide dehydrogenase large subunit
MNKPLDIAFAAIGKPLARKEDQRLVTGKGRFSDDFNVDGQAYMAVVRSPHPHARIDLIETSAARDLPGVLAVLTGEDLLADGLKPIAHTPLPSTKYDMKLTAPDGSANAFFGPHHLLAVGRVRYVGEAVALVVAETKAQALDAAEAVEIAYDDLPFVESSEDALKPGAPAVWDEVPGNTLIETWFGDKEKTDRAFAQADHVTSMDFHIGRVTAVPMELRAALGHYDEATGRYTLHAGSGGAVRQKQEMAAVLGVKPDAIRVLSYDVGGNFGSRNRPYPEFGMVLWASKKIGRPVKYTATRSEAFISDYQGRDLITKVSLALRKDGKILALRADNISNVGANCVSLSPLGKGSGLITGSYDIPVASLRSRAVFTNTMPTNAYRSSGRPEVTYAIERLMDTAATELKLDRIRIRRKNLVRAKQMPYTNAVGAQYDSGTYAANMDLAMAIADWDGAKERRREAKKRGKLLGLGLANYVESSIGSPRERTDIIVKPEGRVDVVIGTQPSGQGHETSFAQVAADLLGLPIGTVNIVIGDTDVVSAGGGSHSGRSMRHAATVMAKAATDLIANGQKIAAVLLDTTADDVSFDDGRFASTKSNRTFNFLELAEAASRAALPAELKDGLTVRMDNEMHEPVFPNGCAICEVEIDPDTGAVALTRYAAVDDVGRCINPLIVHGQTHGGIAQGVGQALWEECVNDPHSGQPLVGSFMDYAMPRASTLPPFKAEIVEVLSPTNPFGIKAGGEGGTTPALAVIVSAVVDALKGFGVRDIAMPVTVEKVWRVIQESQPGRSRESGNP